jgi:sporulation protein YlmC with PRC-barrel domain
VLGARVFTDAGDYFGQIEEVNLVSNKIDGWRIKVDSSVTSFIGGAKGIIIPHHFVKAISDVFIINKAALPNKDHDFGSMSEDLE